jgi:minimal PKS acyl carrier protein
MTVTNWSADELFVMLAEHAGLSHDERPASLDVTFAEIGLDSLAYLQLQTVVTDRFGVALPDEGVATYTLATILTAVNTALAEREVA